MQNILAQLLDIDKINAALASKDFAEFVSFTKKDYLLKPFHEYICRRLEAFSRGEVKKMMIFAPPQHGKSELASRRFPAWELGGKPWLKVAIASYSATIAHEFGRDVKNIINSHEYRNAFPTVRTGMPIGDSSFSNASYYYHITDTSGRHPSGYLYTVGRGGSINSKSVDLAIIDDILKGRDEANSLTIKNKMWAWYVDDWRSRLHNDSRELVMTTRWAEDDLAGRLLKAEPGEWEVIIFPAIKTDDYCPYDRRKPGQVLFPERHSYKKLMKVKRLNEVSFNALYQQDPKPSSQLLVHQFIKVKEFPTGQINKWIVGVDYGMNDPVALVKIGCIENKRYWKTLVYRPGNEMIAEIMNNPKATDDEKSGIIIKVLVAALRNEGITGGMVFTEHDPVKTRQWVKHGFAAVNARKEVASGLESVNECENYYLEEDLFLYNEVSKYQYQSVGEIILNVPVDGNDHIMNAGRYAIHTDKVFNSGR